VSEDKAFSSDVSITHKRTVLIVPDKDADGLSGGLLARRSLVLMISAGSLLYRALLHLGLPSEKISVHHLSKGTNVHSDEERDLMMAYGAERVIVLDQGSRPGRSVVPSIQDVRNVLIVDHHMSDEVGRLVFRRANTSVA
jgi:single-stranded DNA-specific DHH superfamily exonuclease